MFENSLTAGVPTRQVVAIKLVMLRPNAAMWLATHCSYTSRFSKRRCVTLDRPLRYVNYSFTIVENSLVYGGMPTGKVVAIKKLVMLRPNAAMWLATHCSYTSTINSRDMCFNVWGFKNVLCPSDLSVFTEWWVLEMFFNHDGFHRQNKSFFSIGFFEISRLRSLTPVYVSYKTTRWRRLHGWPKVVFKRFETAVRQSS